MIDWSRFPEMFVLGSAGAISMEIIKVYELRGKLHHIKYRTLLRSPMFWIVSVLFVIVSGLISWAFNESNANAHVWQLVASGMGASALAKKFSEAVASTSRVDAGERSLSLRDIFK